MDRHPELAFFNRLSGHLRIELSEPALPVAPHLGNLAAPAGSELRSLSLEVAVHHVYFEGLTPEADGAWSISWGS